MSRRSLIAVLAVVALLASASVSSSRSLVLAAKATFTGSGTSWALDLMNTGTDPLRCMRAFAPGGVSFTSVSGPAGTQNQGSVFGNAALNVAPGASAMFTVGTSGPLTQANAPRVNVSANCVTDAPAEVVVQAAPVPVPKVCECKKIRIVGKNYSSAQVNKGPAQLRLTLHWFMTCSAGEGECKGRFEILPPAGSDVKIVLPKKTTVDCNGKCNPNVATTSDGGVLMRATSAADLDFDNRRNKRFAFRFKLTCVRDGKDVPAGTAKITLAFNGAGFLDKKKSDLNGNGRADGSEKKK